MTDKIQLQPQKAPLLNGTEAVVVSLWGRTGDCPGGEPARHRATRVVATSRRLDDRSIGGEAGDHEAPVACDRCRQPVPRTADPPVLIHRRAQV